MSLPVWADAAGLPTRHAIRAALRVAALIDSDGSRIVDARETYWHVASGATLPPDDLTMGEALLVDLRLAVVRNGVLYRTTPLEALLEGDDRSAATSILLASVGTVSDPIALEHELRHRLDGFGLNDEQTKDAIAVATAKFDAAYRTLVGAIGEDIVVAEARSELAAAGRDDLSRAVRRVSLVSDAYGYDVVAPRVHGADRLLEVKTTTSPLPKEITFFLSRHEAEVARERQNWMLIFCLVDDVDSREGSVFGWLPFSSIEKRLPTDSEYGRWESTSIRIPADQVMPGLPSAFV